MFVRVRECARECVRVSLTGVDSLKVNVFLQLSPEFDFSSIFPDCPIIHQDEMRVEVIQHVEFTERIQQGLVRRYNLNTHTHTTMISYRCFETFLI